MLMKLNAFRATTSAEGGYLAKASTAAPVATKKAEMDPTRTLCLPRSQKSKNDTGMADKTAANSPRVPNHVTSPTVGVGDTSLHHCGNATNGIIGTIRSSEA
jgi:hypothetical protein